MPAEFAATPYSTTTLPVNTFPVSAVFVPGTSSGNLIALQGGPSSTDSNGYTSAPMAVYQATGTNLHTVVDSGTVTANAGSGTFTVAGTVTANQGGTWTIQPGNTANTTPWLTTINQGGNSAAVTATNALSVAELNQDLVDSGNSTTTVLTANSTFTGTGRSTLNYSYIQLYVYSDQSSAASGVMIEFSSDNTNWNDASLFTFTAGGTVPNNGQTYGAATRAQYYRIAYTNGSTNQTAFRLQATLKDHSTPADMVTMTTVPNSTNHAMLTKSSIVGLTTGGGGGYVDVKVNPSGTLTVDASGTTIPVSQSGTWTVTSNPTYPLPTGSPSFIFKEVKNVSVTAGTPVSIWTPASGKKFRMIGANLYPTGTATSAIYLEDGTGVEFLRFPRLNSANTAPTFYNFYPNGYLSSTANNQLFIDVSVSCSVEGFAWGLEE